MANLEVKESAEGTSRSLIGVVYYFNLILGIIAFVISTFVSSEILREIILISSWVLIWDMVETEIQHKVDRAIEQTINSLNSECPSGDYCKERIQKLLNNTYLNQSAFDRVVKEELKNRVIKVSLVNTENEKDIHLS